MDSLYIVFPIAQIGQIPNNPVLIGNYYEYPLKSSQAQVLFNSIFKPFKKVTAIKGNLFKVSSIYDIQKINNFWIYADKKLRSNKYYLSVNTREPFIYAGKRGKEIKEIEFSYTFNLKNNAISFGLKHGDKFQKFFYDPFYSWPFNYFSIDIDFERDSKQLIKQIANSLLKNLIDLGIPCNRAPHYIQMLIHEIYDIHKESYETYEGTPKGLLGYVQKNDFSSLNMVFKKE